MKKALLLFAALLVTGCGESEPVGEANVASAKEESPIGVPPLDIKSIAALAAKHQEKVELRENRIRTEDGPRVEGYLYYIKGTDKLYSGVHYEAMSGPAADGEFYVVGNVKDGKPDGPGTVWHENGQKMAEVTIKDGKELSAKYWNSKGEEVETAEEALEKPATEPSADTAKTPPAEPPVGESPSGEPSETPNSLSDADVERLLKEAVDGEAGVDVREDGCLIHPDGSGLLSGWMKWHDPEYGPSLQRFKDGKMDGLRLRWYKNGELGEEEGWDNGELVAVTVWMPNGEKCPNTKFENGNGIVYGYWDNGQKSFQGSFKNGKGSGVHTSWHENGQKEDETTYKDGKEDGLSTQWHENGKKSYEVTTKDGKKNGLETVWDDNGQKELEKTYKDGKEDGLWTQWYENGQKEWEATYKDGEEVSGKYWNSKGEEVETWLEAQK